MEMRLSLLPPPPRLEMAPTPKPSSKTKPLKPYRRGETLGKASRSSGKASKAAPTAAVSVKPVAVEVEKVESPFEEEEEEEVEEEDEAEKDEEDEDAFDSVVPEPVPIKRKSSKKGKKFVESQVSVCCFLKVGGTRMEETRQAWDNL